MKLPINLICGNRFTFLLLSLLFFSLQANAQKIISGIVSDESGPLPGVSILEKGTSNGTVTDFDGAYTISVANKNATLVFSHLGFLTQEHSNLQYDTLDIQMLEDVLGLEEIVVTGYGTQKKATLTGSIATIGGEALEKSASPNLGTALAGKVAGVYIDSGNGAPGADNPAIRVRGTNTFTKDPTLFATIVGVDDNVIPSANAVMAENLWTLGKWTGKENYSKQAEKMLQGVLPYFSQGRSSDYAQWGQLLLKEAYPHYEVVIVGPEAENETITFQKEYYPNVLFQASKTESDLPLLKDRFFEGETYIYVCQNRVCLQPVESVKEAIKQMESWENEN